MRRLLVLGLSFAIALGLIVDYAFRAHYDEAVEAGKALHPYRAPLLRRLEASARSERARVAWLGDSTIMGFGAPSYPREIAARFPAVDSWVVGHPGLDAFGYYFLMGPVLERRPEAVVLVANPRLLGEAVHTMNDLAALLPTEELPRAALLPTFARGLTVPRLLLARMLRWEWAEDAMYFLEGIRELWQQAAIWDWLGSAGPSASLSFARYLATFRLMSEKYDQPIAESTPTVQMLGAAVRMATERAVPALVVVTPIPWEELERQGRYDKKVYAGRIAALREVVTANGGTLVDLHRELRRPEFRDNGGHFTADGVRHVVGVLAPAVLDLAGAPPPAF